MYGVVVCPRCKRGNSNSSRSPTGSGSSPDWGFPTPRRPSRRWCRRTPCSNRRPASSERSSSIPSRRGATTLSSQLAADVLGKRARQNLAVDVVIDQQGKADGRDRGNRAVRFVHLEQERREERPVREADADRPQERSPRVSARGAETDQRPRIRIHETEADRVDDEKREGLGHVQNVTRRPRRRDDAARGGSESQRHAVERCVESAPVAPAIEPRKLERLLEDKADPDGDGKRYQVPAREGEREDARHGAEDETDGEASEHATVVEQRVVDLGPVEASEGGPQDGEPGENSKKERDEEIQVRGHGDRKKARTLLKNAADYRA